MPRQTDLTYEQIVEKLNTGFTAMPDCGCGGIGLLISELVEMAREGDEKAKAKLIKLLKSDDPKVRKLTCGCLGIICGCLEVEAIESEKVLEPLEELLKTEKEPMVKETAEKLIAQIRARIKEVQMESMKGKRVRI